MFEREKSQYMERLSIERCGQLLAKKKLTLAFAESATAGRAAMEFSLCPNSGEFLKGGIVCYDACLKQDILHVHKGLIEEFTPEVTYAIAKGLMSVIPADITIGITGLTWAGGSETREKPVGTMFFCAILGENKLFEDSQIFQGNEIAIAEQAIVHLSKRLYQELT